MKHSILKVSRSLRSFLVGAVFIAAVQMVSAEENPVAAVQTALKLKRFYYGDVDGNFDCATQNALRRFQFRNGLPGTGAMDPETLHILCGYPPAPPAPPKAMAAHRPAGPEIDRELVPPIEKIEFRAGIQAAPGADRKRAPSAELITKEPPTAPHAAYSEQFPSWAAEHRVIDNGIEIRRAIPITPQTGNQQQFIPRAIPVTSADSIGGAGDRVAVTTVTAHFTGQDGHVYSYYRKMKTMAPAASRSPASPYGPFGLGQTAGSSSLEFPDGEGNLGGSIAHR